MVLALLISVTALRAETATSVNQYGITWTFDKPHTVGKFVTGDWWVIGPVVITSVTPSPGSAEAGQEGALIKGRYGVAMFTNDGRMRNGSMIFPELKDKTKGTETGKYAIRKVYVVKPEVSNEGYAVDDMPQGFDSRDARNYVPTLSIKFPKELKPGESLCSSISYPEPIQQTYGKEIKLYSGGKTMLQTVAILTCLNTAPPADAFRPPYAGTYKPIFETKNLQWNLLQNLPIPPTWKDEGNRLQGAVPDWHVMEQLVERPAIDRIIGNVNENATTYGREFSRVNGMATLMLNLNVPKEKKEKLLISMVQRGIDYYGLMKSGQNWVPDGCINLGRKGLLIFAGQMLGEKDFYNFPSWSLWQEDTDTYYGTAWNGEQTALWQCTWHSGPANGLPFEEMPLNKRGQREIFAWAYGISNSDSYIGTDLAALLMKAKAIWNHDAFFDYVDRYMRQDASLVYPTKGEVFNVDNPWVHVPDKDMGQPIGHAFDSFIEAMWKTYRNKVPDQPNGKDNKKWVWTSTDMVKGYGEFVPNPKPANLK